MVEAKEIKVLLVDDSEAILECLNDYLPVKTNIEVIGKASDGRQAIDLSGQLLPDVILMDINMPVLDGIEATREILLRHPSIKVIAHSFLLDKASTEKMSEAGASSFLQKGCSLGEIVEAIRETAG
jgi:DNA-binding NarL/FixJ family response regulator